LGVTCIATIVTGLALDSSLVASAVEQAADALLANHVSVLTPVPIRRPNSDLRCPVPLARMSMIYLARSHGRFRSD